MKAEYFVCLLQVESFSIGAADEELGPFKFCAEIWSAKTLISPLKE